MVQLGRTRIYTRRQRWALSLLFLWALFGILLAAMISAAAWSWITGDGWALPQFTLRSPFTTSGHGGLLGLPHYGEPAPPPSSTSARFPLAVHWTAPLLGTALFAVPLAAGWLRWAVWPLRTGRGDARKTGLATVNQIRSALSGHTARTLGKQTRPEFTWRSRLLLCDTEFGARLVRPIAPRIRGWVLASWERSVRLIAPSGWGKTFRLLVPLIRQLPGPALIASNEPGLFTHTARARELRALAPRWNFLRYLRPSMWAARTFPVWVLVFAPEGTDWAPGYPRVKWSPIVGSEKFEVATRRAEALVTGSDTDDGERGSNRDRFWRESAAAVLAAFLHAAALDGASRATLVKWMTSAISSSTTSEPQRILDQHPASDPVARDAFKLHLSRSAEGTTSGVLRYLDLAMTSLRAHSAAAMCDAAPGEQFDMAAAIRALGSVYLLADAQTRVVANPLLSMFANEFVYAAQAEAQQHRRERLPRPFHLVLDELRNGVTVPVLPEAVTGMRKNNIWTLYAAQSEHQELTVYGQRATKEIHSSTLALHGGYEQESAEELRRLGGTQEVVRGSLGYGGHGENIVDLDVVTARDLNELQDGEVYVRARGVRLFKAFAPLVFSRRSMRRRLDREVTSVENGEPAPAAGTPESRQGTRQETTSLAGD